MKLENVDPYVSLLFEHYLEVTMRILLIAVFCALLCSSPLMAGESYDKQFDKLDQNHDGVLNKREFVDGKVKVNKEKALKMFPDMRDMEHLNERKLKERVFEMMDKNHDGLLSKDEWRQVAPNILEIRF
jgi:Ca2+-binding EF-hand superfamily protein